MLLQLKKVIKSMEFWIYCNYHSSQSIAIQIYHFYPLLICIKCGNLKTSLLVGLNDVNVKGLGSIHKKKRKKSWIPSELPWVFHGKKPPGRKNLLFQWGWSWKNCRKVGWYLETQQKIHHEFNEFFCAGFNNRHDLSYFFYIFSSHFFHLSFLYGKMWPQWYGTWLARQMEHSEWRLSQRSWIWSSA